MCGIDAEAGGDGAALGGLLLQHLGVVVEPAEQPPLARRNLQAQDLVLAAEARIDGRQQRLDRPPLSGPRRARAPIGRAAMARSASVRAAASSRSALFQTSRIGASAAAASMPRSASTAVDVVAAALASRRGRCRARAG